MAQDWKLDKPNCIIEFRIYDEKRYRTMAHFFKPLREYTHNLGNTTLSPDASTEETQERRQIGATEVTTTRRNFAKPEEWLLALRPTDMAFLGMPDHKNAIIILRDWQGLSRRERRQLIKASDQKKQLQALADFNDMLRYWQDVEFELLELQQIAPDKAHIVYSTFDFPFKGKAALEELLMFFGFLSILKHTC